MFKKFAVIGMAMFALAGCQQNKNTPSICTVDVGAQVVWKEYKPGGRSRDEYMVYFKYAPIAQTTNTVENVQPEQQPSVDFSNAFCRVDNQELYVRLNIGDAVPWAYQGDFIIKR